MVRESMSTRIKSDGDSIPIESRTMSAGNARSLFTSSGIDAWLMSPGNDTREFTDPKETVILNRPDAAHAEATAVDKW